MVVMVVMMVEIHTDRHGHIHFPHGSVSVFDDDDDDGDYFLR